MVKFAKHLELQLVPEWRDAYVSYKKLKKDIKRIPPVRLRTFRGSSGGSVHGGGEQDPDADGQRTPRRRSSASLNTLIRRSRSRARLQPGTDYITVRTVRGDAADGSADTYYTDVLPPVNESPEEVTFFARMDAQLNKVNLFYGKKEQEYSARLQHLERQIAALNEMKSALAKKQEQMNAAASSSPRSPEGPQSPRAETAPAVANEALPRVALQELANGRDADGVQNGRQGADRRREASTPAGQSGYRDGENCQREAMDGETTIPDIRSLRLVIPAATPVLALNKMSRVLWNDIARSGTRAESVLAELSDDVTEVLKQSRSTIKRAEKLLHSATVEFYRGLGLLKSFSSLNTVAFGKILKKHDKVVGWTAARPYLAAVERAHFCASPAVVQMMAATEALFTKQFAGDSHKQAMQVLRPVHRSASHQVTYALGFFSGCILSLLITFIVLISNAGGYDQRGGADYLHSVFPVFTAMLLLLLHMFVYGGNVYCWRIKQINYSFIFEFRPGTELRVREVLLAASLMTTLTLGGMVLHLVLHTADPRVHGGAGEYIPLAVLLVWLAVFLCPLDLFWRPSRMFLLRILRHLALAPLYRVMLADFFVGDQLTSQIPFLQQLQYCCCYYFGGHFKNRDGAACTGNGTYRSMLYVVAILPYWFRFAQCWRRFFEEGRERVHVANAGKYLSAMLAVSFRLWYLNSGTRAGLVLSIIAAVVATAYQAYWDLVMDWGLLRRHARHPWLRDQLVLKHNSIYYAAMVADVVLRLAWIQSISRFRFGGRVPPSIMTLIAASLEVLRRGLWNFFRLENEHLNNVGKFRAVRSIPLPFKDLEGAEV
ncbi:phosphate transporter [Klebsormidium nitens]|uniref:Phosphate transporter n=1 Tax=Klebsormidium nitens TaxID=105231 RepID=A0A1Y1IQG8_KLENI|nr:phosphate transporter [Klebsormidium nitens]|eukprot:GAQ90378.1 phosphate transporter [Klebsormidium nitens]